MSSHTTAVTVGIQPNVTERKLFSLSPSFGGLGIPLFSEIADKKRWLSVK